MKWYHYIFSVGAYIVLLPIIVIFSWFSFNQGVKIAVEEME